MIFFKPNICFKLKDFDNCFFDICNRLNFSSNSYEIEKLKSFINYKFDLGIEQAKSNFKVQYMLHKEQAEKQVNSFKLFWTKTGEEFLKDVFSCFNIKPQGEKQFLVFVDCAPLPYIQFYESKLSLSVFDNLDFNLTYFLSFIVKSLLLNIFSKSENIGADLDYGKDSAYWIMADLVADCLFSETKLKKYAENVAYKYYYNLKIGDENVINMLRTKFKSMDLPSFMRYVFKKLDCF